MRLIDAGYLLKQEWFVEYHPYEADGTIVDADIVAEEVVNQCKKIVANTPEVDAVPVVRCKDCVNAIKQEGYITCRYFKGAVLPHWYCWKGKRRVNATNS